MHIDGRYYIFSVRRKFSLIRLTFIFQHVNGDDPWVRQIKIKIKMSARAVSLLPKWKPIEVLVTFV